MPKQNTYAQDADGKAAFVERYVEQQPISEEPGRIIHAVTWQSSLQLDDEAFTEVLHGDSARLLLPQNRASSSDARRGRARGSSPNF